MKILIFLFLTLFIICISSPIIANTPIPVIQIKKVLEISDEGGDKGFYFKRPANIKIAPDGSIFLIDENQFLRFDRAGKFLNNQQKKGAGPSEYAFIYNYDFLGDKIILLTGPTQKVIETDLTGKLLKEYRLEKNIGFLKVVKFSEDRIWFVGSTLRDLSKQELGKSKAEFKLGYISQEGKLVDSNIFFNEEWFLMKKAFGENVQVMMTSLVPIVYSSDKGNNLFISDSGEYKIHKVDLKKIKKTEDFSRKFERIPYEDEGVKEEKGRKDISIPAPEYYNDILKLMVYDDYLFVLTAKVEKGKGVIVDVFFKDGKYLKRFYLPLPQFKTVKDVMVTPLNIDNSFIYTIETDEEDNKVLIKYEGDFSFLK